MWLFQASGEDPLKELRQLRKRNKKLEALLEEHKELEALRKRNKELKALHERYSQLAREKEALENENASLRQRIENGKAAAADTSDSADG